jgi:8-oxo-dGTP pyrophosphatase MutT (NUDIX family)
MDTNQRFLSDTKIRSWLNTIASAGCTINGVNPLATVYKKNGQVLFAFVETDITTPEGPKLLPYCFVRGHGCIVIIMLRNRDNGEERFLMIEQRRIGHGRLALEFPAGMVDEEVDNPRGVALRELGEETGLSIDGSLLHELHHRPLYSSAGGCDEALYYYGCLLELSGEEYKSLEGRQTGKHAENEHIRVTLKTLRQAEAEICSALALLGLHLFKQKFLSGDTARGPIASCQ